MLRMTSSLIPVRGYSTVLTYSRLQELYKRMEFGQIVDEVNKSGAYNQPKNIQEIYKNAVKAIQHESKINEITNKYVISEKAAFQTRAVSFDHEVMWLLVLIRLILKRALGDVRLIIRSEKC